MHRIKDRWLLFGVALLLLLVAGVAVSAAKHNGARRSESSPATKRPKPEAQFHEFGRCSKAHVALGVHPGTVNFSVWCRGGTPKKVVGFVVTRAIMPYAGVHSGMVLLNSKSQAPGPDASVHFGACEFVRGQIACHRLARGKVQLSGKIVMRSHLCKWPVVITSALPSGDEREGWSGPLRIKVLSKGKPKGC